VKLTETAAEAGLTVDAVNWTHRRIPGRPHLPARPAGERAPILSPVGSRRASS
jgi:hypothetical protein